MDEVRPLGRVIQPIKNPEVFFKGKGGGGPAGELAGKRK